MSTEPRRDYGGMAFAAAFILLGVWALLETREMSSLAAVFPRTIASAMIVFAIGYIVLAVLRPLLARPSRPFESTPRRVLLGILLLAWILLMPVLGFVTTSLIAFIALTAVANYHAWTPFRLIVYPVTAVCVVAGFYALFAYALKVPLPQGLLI